MIRAFRLVTADPDRLVAFYQSIGFVSGQTIAIADDEMQVLGLPGSGRRHPLTLGDSRIELDWFDPPGLPYPADANAADLIFQHLALVTDDAGTAWHRATDAGATPISRGGPIRLPKSAGGVTAGKFRDPDGHPLEFLQFPAGANPAWTGSGMMGIDHSAISVSDIAASRRFYARHGLADGRTSFNRGSAQVALDGLEDVQVDILPMNPPTTPPHVELLGYHIPTGRPHTPLAANDIAATRIVWRAETDALLRDPDGHLHQLTRKDRSPADTVSRR
ncbi:VOC family protein [Novosphingopyxis sp.]|uniref:VOC family protein n=1 Tax=Novosphingopyxis sp. TaxID=2709690 RepID=UPI003B5BA5E0